MSNHLKIIFAHLVAIFFILCALKAQAATGDFLAAQRLGGTNNDWFNQIAFDTAGNMVFVGYLTGDVDLNGDSDTADSGESATGFGSTDAFLLFTDSDGTYQWAKRLGGTSYDDGRSVAIDPQGDLIVSGCITGDADLNGDGDTGDSGESATGFGGQDIFISVFSHSGSPKWAKRLGSTSDDNSVEVRIDTQDRVIVSGYVIGAADLNGDGDKTDSQEASGNGNKDGILAVFDADGNHEWSKRFGNAGNDDANGIVLDAEDNIYVVFLATGDSDVNGDGDSTDGGAESATGYGSSDVIVGAFAADSSALWSKRLGGTSADASSLRIIILNTNNQLILGYMGTDNVDVNGDGDSTDGGAESGLGYDLLFGAFTTDGTHQWTKRIDTSNTGGDELSVVDHDAYGNIFIAGLVEESIDLNFDGDMTDAGEPEGVGPGSVDAYAAAYTASGDYLWSKRIDVETWCDNYSFAIDSSDDFYFAGEIDEAYDFNADGDTLDTGESSLGTGDAYWAKYEGFHAPSAPASNITSIPDPTYGNQGHTIVATYTDTNDYADLANLYLKLDHPTDPDIEVYFAESGASGSGYVTIVSGASYLGGTPSYTYSTSGDNLTAIFTFKLNTIWSETRFLEYAIKAVDDISLATSYASTDTDVYFKHVGPSGRPATAPLQDLKTPADLPGAIQDEDSSPTPPGPSKYNPLGGFDFLINGGALKTSNLEVALYLFGGPDTEYVLVSEDPTFKGVQKIPYTPHLHYTFQKGQVQNKTIYVQFLNQAEISTSAIQQTIILADSWEQPLKTTSAPTCTTIIVKNQDSLWKIARNYLFQGSLYFSLISLNQENYPTLSHNPDYLRPGWELKVECE